jgi:zinc/manganese transport system permease protein
MIGMLSHDFMRQAFLAGIPIAALAGLVGYFMVLRSQVFTGDALSHVAFTGALGALAFGIDPRVGLYISTIAVALLLGLLGNHGRADDVVIGTIFVWILGLGVLAISLYSASPRSSVNSAAGVTILFGSIYGLSASQAQVAAMIAIALVVLLLSFARPLLFSSIDEAVASARGLPVRALGLGFLVIAGATAAEATQAVGALLLLGLLAAPAGAAQRLTNRPYVAMALSSAIAISSMVLGLIASYFLPKIPPSFGILGIAVLSYASAFTFQIMGARLRRYGGVRVFGMSGSKD